MTSRVASTYAAATVPTQVNSRIRRPVRRDPAERTGLPRAGATEATATTTDLTFIDFSPSATVAGGSRHVCSIERTRSPQRLQQGELGLWAVRARCEPFGTDTPDRGLIRLL
jgi:hypothetical protein